MLTYLFLIFLLFRQVFPFEPRTELCVLYENKIMDFIMDSWERDYYLENGIFDASGPRDATPIRFVIDYGNVRKQTFILINIDFQATHLHLLM